MAGNEYRRLAPRACGQCAGAFAPERLESRYCGRTCYEASRAPVRRECRWCCKVYVPKAPNRADFCSRACYFARKSALSGEASSSTVHFNTCTMCGTQWTARRAKAECSRACELERGRRSADARARQQHRAAGRVVTCVGCDARFCPVYGSKVTATPLCAPCAAQRRRAQAAASGKNHAARAKKRGVERRHFNALRIFERDRWTCRLCGVKTPRALKGTTHPRAPELDHIITFNEGGAHTQENVQCACRQCNGLKGGRSLGQMLLVGFADMRVA